MGFRSSGQHDVSIPDIWIDSRQPAERKQACDSRYRSIIGQLDAMIELARRQPERSLVEEFGQLLASMRGHIASENSFMEQVGFPQAVKHRLHHLFICTTADELCNRFRTGQKVQPEELNHIRLLWMEHIHVHDRAFEEFLTS